MRVLRLLVLAIAAVATQAAAQSAVRSDPYAAQVEAERANAEAREYGRLTAQAVNRRQDHPAEDFVFDITQFVVPDIVTPIVSPDTPTSQPWTTIGSHVETPAAVVLRLTGLPAAALDADPDLSARVHALATARAACNTAARRAIADWLRASYPAAHLHDVWEYGMPNAGMDVRVDGAVPLAGQPLLVFSPTTPTRLVAAPNRGPRYIIDRRQRAQLFLANNRYGHAVVRGLDGWFARPGTTQPAGACPVQAPLIEAAEAAIRAARR